MQKKNMALLIILFPLTVWLIPGILGGVVTAFAVKWADKRLDTRNFVIILSGWAGGMMVGGIAGEAFWILSVSRTFYLLTNSYFKVDDLSRWIIAMSITGMVTAFIGSLTTHRVLKSLSAKENAG